MIRTIRKRAWYLAGAGRCTEGDDLDICTKEMMAHAELRMSSSNKKAKVCVCMQPGSIDCWAIYQAYNEAWAKDQFSSGLAPRGAELLLLKSPRSLQDFAVEAKRIEVTLKVCSSYSSHRRTESGCIIIVWPGK